MDRCFPVTGVGSLPFQSIELACDYAAAMDLSYVPQLPQYDSNEFMIPQTLRGLNGFKNISNHKYLIETPTIELDNYRPFLDYCCWNLIAHQSPSALKVQITGIGTILKYVDCADRYSATVCDFIYQKTEAIVKELKKKGIASIICFDEPAGINDELIQRYEKILNLQHIEGTTIGVHCCSDTNWSDLLRSDFRYISYDAILSNKNVFRDGPILKKYLEQGGMIAPGVIPTTELHEFDQKKSQNKFWDQLISVLTKEEIKNYSSNIIITATCGHAYCSEEATNQSLDHLKNFAMFLRGMIN